MQNGDVDGASVILEHMKDREISINEHVFNSLIVGHARSGNFEEARYHKRFFTLNPKLYGYNFHNESRMRFGNPIHHLSYDRRIYRGVLVSNSTIEWSFTHQFLSLQVSVLTRHESFNLGHFILNEP